MKTGIELIAEERREQIEKHGRTVELDVQQNADYQLSEAFGALIIHPTEDDMKDVWGDILLKSVPSGWNKAIWEKMAVKPYKERLIIAGALIAAEIDRLNAIESLN